MTGRAFPAEMAKKGARPPVGTKGAADRLLSIRPSDNLTRVFLELSGTGAAEGAVKHAIEASGRPLILSFMGQYHGLSIGATAFGTLASRMRRNWEAFSGGAVH